MKRSIRIKKWLADDAGVTMIEYGLLAALVAVVCILAVTNLGTNLNATYSNVCQAVITAITGAPGNC